MISQFVGLSPMSGSLLSVQSLLWILCPPLSLPLPCFLSLSKINIKNMKNRGAWVGHLVKHLTSAQVMISRFVGSSPMLGSVLTAQSLEPASDSVFPSFSALPLLMLCLSRSLKKINIKKIKTKIKNTKGPCQTHSLPRFSPVLSSVLSTFYM